MKSIDFTLTISERQAAGYPAVASSAELGRAAATLPPPPVALTAALRRASEAASEPEALRTAGSLLFEWGFPPPIRAQLRTAWGQAEQAREQLHILLHIDAPEFAAWPWELLYDADRHYAFAASAATPLVRIYPQAEHFRSSTALPVDELSTDLPIDLLLLLPSAPDLNLAAERKNVEEVAAATEGALRVRTLAGGVTRADLADGLLLGNYSILHFAGHGGFANNQGLLSLNGADGSADWLDSAALGRLLSNYRSIRLAILNACDVGRVADARAFAGLAPHLLAAGISAVVAMQFPISDLAAATFAREFYKRLCVGDEAGQVDIAVAYARSMLSVLHPGDRSWAAPVLFTTAPDGVIFKVPPRVRAGGALDPLLQRERLLALTASLRGSLLSEDDWHRADAATLRTWLEMTERAGEAYRAHLAHPRLEVRQAAEQGLELVGKRLAALQAALAGSA